MKRMIASMMMMAALSSGQTMPEGTKVRLRLEQNLSSANARVGDLVQFSVMEDVLVGDTVVIPQGSAASGTVILAEPKRSMGRAGKLDFSIERVRIIDGRSVNLRASSNRQSGKGSGMKTGLITAGVAFVFRPAAPLALLVKGKDVEVARGLTLDAFTDADYVVGGRKTASQNVSSSVTAPSEKPAAPPATSAVPQETGQLTVTASSPDSEVLIDGKFVGNAPSTLRLAAGPHRIEVKGPAGQWERDVEVPAGSNITINAASQARLAVNRQ